MIKTLVCDIDELTAMLDILGHEGYEVTSVIRGINAAVISFRYDPSFH